MSSLEQSLDAIIAQSSKSSGKPASRRTLKGSKRPQIQSKSNVSRVRNNLRNSRNSIQRGGNIRRSNVPPQRASTPKITKKTIESASLDVATKVVVSGLPKELDQRTIRDFFQKSVGQVNSLTLSFNERGRSTGVATVIFKDSKHARAAVSRFNNANIDGGNSKLKLELVVDTSKVPLAARIQPNVTPSQPARRGRALSAVKGRPLPVSNRSNRPSRGPVRGVNRSNRVGNKRSETPKKQPRKKKTLQELDQEMADYFATNDK